MSSSTDVDRYVRLSLHLDTFSGHQVNKFIGSSYLIQCVLREYMRELWSLAPLPAIFQLYRGSVEFKKKGNATIPDLV